MWAARSIGIVVLAAAFSGCSPPVAETPGTSHLYAAPLGRVWETVERSLAELNYTADDKRYDGGGGILHARRDDVGGLTVSAVPFTDSTTVVSVAADASNREAEGEVVARLDAELRPPPPGRPVPTSFLPGR
jgi:hypothetical protein